MPSVDPSSAAHDPPPRRSFLTEFAAVLAGAAVFAAPLLTSLAMLWSPLRRDRGARGSLVPLPITPDAVPADGTPLRQVIWSEHLDAWNHHENERVGTIWIRRNGEGQLEAYSAICPHLGCSVDFRAGERDFFCPCHNSVFSLDGSRMNQIPPRDLDSLEVQLDEGRIWVRYERFRGGTPAKVPV